MWQAGFECIIGIYYWNVFIFHELKWWSRKITCSECFGISGSWFCEIKVVIIYDKYPTQP